MGNARAVRPTTDTTTTTSPPTEDSAQRASFSDGLNSNSPQATYAAQNPETAPKALSASTGDVALKGKKGFQDDAGNSTGAANAGIAANTKKKTATLNGGYTKTDPATGDSKGGSGSVSVDMGDNGNLQGAGASGTYSNNGTSTTAGGNVGFHDTGGVSQVGVKGGHTVKGTGGSGNASANFDEQGRLNGVSAGGKAQANGASVNGSMSTGLTTSAPRQVDDHWEVDWDFDASIAAGAGATKGAFGGKAGGGFSGNRGGTQVFSTEAEANSFRVAFSEGGPEFASQLMNVSDLDDGESLGDSSSMKANVGVSAKAGHVSVGIDAKGSSGSGWTVTRQGGSFLLVVNKDSSLGTTFSGSVLGAIKLSMGDTNRSASSFAIKFKADDVDDNRALSNWLNNGVVSGGEILWLETGREHDDSTGVAILGMRFEWVGTTGKKIVRYADGQTVETQVGQSNEGVSIPLLGKHDESHRLTATTDADGTDFSLKTRVKSDSATSAQKAMAQASGGSTWGSWDGESSGQWSVTSKFSERQIGDFVAWVNGGSARPRLNMVGGGWLVDRMASAGSDKERQRDALNEFVASCGGKGLAVIHEHISGSTQSFPELAGDDTFLGENGWGELSAKADDFEGLADGESAASIASEAAAIAVECDERIALLRDPQNYQDLADNLRSQEVDRNYSMKFRMEMIAKTAKAKAAELILANVDPSAQVGDGSRRPKRTSSDKAADAARAMETELGFLAAQVDDLYTGMQMDQEACLLAKRDFDRSVHMHTHHQGGRRVSPKDYLGHQSAASAWGITVFDGNFVAEYAKAESAGSKGGGELGKANICLGDVARNEADYMRALANPKTAMPVIKDTMALIRETAKFFQSARFHYADADRVYRQIAKDSQGDYPWPSYYP